MGPKNEHAELTKRRKSEPESSLNYRQAGAVLRELRIVVVLCCVLFVLDGLTVRVLGQEPQPWPKTVIIDASNLPTKPLLYGFSEKKPQAETELHFKGDGNWRFIQFDPLPAQTSIKVKGSLRGYQESEPLQGNRWYSFKTNLSVVLEIKQGALSPVTISFRFGSPSREADRLQAGDVKPEDMRAFIDHHELKTDTDKLTLGLTWEGGVTPTSSGSPSPKPTPNPTPESSWWTTLTQEDPLFGLFILVIVLAILLTLGWLSLPGFLRRIRDWRRSRPPKHSTPSRSSPLDSLTDGPGGSTHQEVTPTQGARHPNRMVSYRYDDPTATSKTELAQERAPGQTDDHLASSLAPRTQVASPSIRDGKIAEVERRVQSLETSLGQKADRQDDLTHAARMSVESMLTNSEADILPKMEARFKQSLTDAIQPVKQLMIGQELSVKTEFDKTLGRITQLSTEGDKVKQQLTEVMLELGEVDSRLQTRLDELQKAIREQTVPDSFVARTLGAVLGQGVDMLSDDNFQQLVDQVGGRLDQFLQSGVTRGEGLQELRERADAIKTALKDVSVQMEGLKPLAIEEATQHIKRVDAFVAELSGLQSQLQTRRATIETTLNIPVSMHPGARQTFLDELGRGIRREIDKLSEPESYFDGALERLVTADLIAIVDICDKKVTSGPDTQPQLEGALRKLFEEAGLRPILPRRGEPFKTAEQDLIEMDKGSGPSLTVAEVLTRGFYYKHRDQETLLRKAGVAVYR
jgi:hypothetical protein